jgi:hypothetical protein
LNHSRASVVADIDHVNAQFSEQASRVTDYDPVLLQLDFTNSRFQITRG